MTYQDALSQYNTQLQNAINDVQKVYVPGATYQQAQPALDKLKSFIDPKYAGNVESLAANGRLSELTQPGGFADIGGAYWNGQGGSSISRTTNALGAYGGVDPSKPYTDELNRQQTGDPNFWKTHDAELARVNGIFSAAGIGAIEDPFANVRQGSAQTMTPHTITAADIVANNAAPTGTTALPSTASTTTIPGTNTPIPAAAKENTPTTTENINPFTGKPDTGGTVSAAGVEQTPQTNIPFKQGLSSDQQQSIINLVQSGRSFNETDARNYAFATGDSNWQKYVGHPITTNGTVLPSAASQLTPGQWISPSMWSQLQQQMSPAQLEASVTRSNGDIHWKGATSTSSTPGAAPDALGSAPSPAYGGAMPDGSTKGASSTYDASALLAAAGLSTGSGDSIRKQANDLVTSIFKEIDGLTAFRTNQKSALEKDAGIAGLKATETTASNALHNTDSAIASIDQRIATANNRIALNYEAITNQPVSASIVSGELAHQQRLDSIALNALTAQKQVLVSQKAAEEGDYNRAIDLYNQAEKQVVDSVNDAVDIEKLKINALYKQVDTLQQAASTADTHDFELRKTILAQQLDQITNNAKTLADLMVNNPQAGILPTDSIADASKKLTKMYGAAGFIDPKFSDTVVKDDGRGNTTVLIIDKRNGKLVSQQTYKGISNPDGSGGAATDKVNPALRDAFNSYIQSIQGKTSIPLTTANINALYQQWVTMGQHANVVYTEKTLPPDLKDTVINDIKSVKDGSAGNATIDNVIAAHPNVDSAYIKRLWTIN